MRSVFHKELTIYFASPIFYVVAFMFLLITGIFFYNNLTYESLLATRLAQYQYTAPLSLNDVLLRPLFADVSMLILFVVPLISMRLYAEEMAQGTIELLFTYPLSDLQVLLGKFLAGLVVLLLVLGISLHQMFLLALLTSFDWGIVLASYLGLMLMGGAFLALGMFVSCLTRNQIVASAGTFGLILVFWLVGWLGETLPPGTAAAFLQEISLVGHLSGFIKGMIMLKDVVFYIFFILFFLFGCLRVLESHTWRG